MATINGMYVFIESEELSHEVEVAEHTVEDGIELSDHVKRKAKVTPKAALASLATKLSG